MYSLNNQYQNKSGMIWFVLEILGNCVRAQTGEKLLLATNRGGGELVLLGASEMEQGIHHFTFSHNFLTHHPSCNIIITHF